MEPKAADIQPVFTRPFRQLGLMVIVITATAAGAAFIWPRLVAVFMANPTMNGAIVVVFAIGVITAFVQVIRLTRSITWIGAFLAGAEGGTVAEAPALLAPLAALLGKRANKGGQINATSARSILDSVSSRMEESRDVASYLGNLLIFLGLLGTFYGLAITVPALVETIRALSPPEGSAEVPGGVEMFDRLMHGLENQLGGMGTAFSSSLLGLAGSLVIGLLELFASHGQNRFYAELEDWLSSITRLGLTGGEGEAGMSPAMVALVDHLAAQVEALQAMGAETGAASRATASQMGELALAIQALAARNAVGTGQAEITARIAEGQERLITALQGLEGAGQLDAESRMRLRSMDVQLLRVLEEIAVGRQETLAALRADIAGLTQAIRRQNRKEPG